MVDFLIREEDQQVKERCTEGLVAFALRQAATDTPVAEIVQKMGVTEQTF